MKSPFFLLATSIVLTANALCAEPDVTVILGDKTPAPANPKPDPLKNPFGVDFDREGNMTIGEYEGNRIHRLTPEGKLVHLAGTGEKGYSGDGEDPTQATFNAIHNVAVTPDGDVFISDHVNHVVRKIDGLTGALSTFAGTGERGFGGDGGPANAAKFNTVMCVSLSPDNEVLYVADLGNRRIRAIDLKTNVVSTVAGNGETGIPKDGSKATKAPLVDPRAVAADFDGNIYIIDRNGHALRVVRSDGTIETVAGTGQKGFADGPALEAQFNAPKHLVCSEAGDVYIADDMNHRIRKYSPSTKTVFTVLGNGAFKLKRPHGVCLEDGWLYITDSYHNRLLKMRP